MQNNIPTNRNTTKIFNAVITGNLRLLTECIDTIENIDIKSGGKTLLHEAVLYRGEMEYDSNEKKNETKDFENNKIEVATNMVKALLDAGASPKIIDDSGNGPLIYAIAKSRGNNIEIPRMLLEKGADANAIGHVTKGNIAKRISGIGFNESLPFTEKTPLVLALLANKLHSEKVTVELMQLLCEHGADTSSLYEFLESTKKYLSGEAGGIAGGGAGGIAGVGAGGIADDGASRKIGTKLGLKLNSLLKILPKLEENYPNEKFQNYDINGALETIREKVSNKSQVDREPAPKSTPPSKSYLQNQVSSLQAQVEALQCVTALLLDIIAQTPQNQSEIESSSEGRPSKKQKTDDRNPNFDPQNQGEEQGGRTATSLQASGARQDANTQGQHSTELRDQELALANFLQNLNPESSKPSDSTEMRKEGSSERVASSIKDKKSQGK